MLSRGSFALLLSLSLLVPAASSAETVLGVRVSGGGRFDNVRKCVASSPGTKGGPAADIAAFLELGLRKDVALVLNLPVMRPILFAAAFKMLQLEPDVTLAFRLRAGGPTSSSVRRSASRSTTDPTTPRRARAPAAVPPSSRSGR